MADLPAVHLELCFTGTTCTNSAAKPGQMGAVAGQSRQSIGQLRQLDLEFAFLGPGAPGKNVQYQACAIDHFRIENFLQILGLAGRQFVVKNDHVHALKNNLLADLFDFTTADEGGRIGTVATLNHLSDNSSAGRRGQFT